MAAQSSSGSDPSRTDASALDREADHVQQLQSGSYANKKKETEADGLNNPLQVEQDLRVERAKVEAETQGRGSQAPEEGLNQDG